MKIENKELKKDLKQLQKIYLDEFRSVEILDLLISLDESVTNKKFSKYRFVDILFFKDLQMFRAKVLSLIVFILIVTLIGSFYTLGRSKNFVNNERYLTGPEKERVLQEITIRNPLIDIKGNNLKANNLNYVYTKATWSDGPKYSECKLDGSNTGGNFYFKENANSYESWQYFGSKLQETTKIIEKDADGKILLAYIGNYLDPKVSIRYQYQGGKYALREVSNHEFMYEDEIVFPEDVGISPINDSLDDYKIFIESYYRQTPEVIETSEGNYILLYSSSIECDRELGAQLRGDGSEHVTNKIVTKDYISKDNFQIYKTKTYLDSIADKNLLRETNYIYNLEETNLESIKLDFSELDGIEVREIKGRDGHGLIPTQDEIYSEVIGVIKDKGIPIIYLDEQKYFTSFSKQSNQYEFSDFEIVLDRDFYSDDEGGQKLYEYYTSYYASIVASSPILHTSTSLLYDPNFDPNTMDMEAYNFTFYDKSRSISLLKSELMGGKEFYEEPVESRVQEIELDGEKVNILIDKYILEQENPNSPHYKGGSFEEEYLYDCHESICKFDGYTVFIEFETGYYQYASRSPYMTIDSVNKFLNKGFLVLNPSNPEDLTKIEELIRKSIEAGG
jgi:hypothetical protein